MKTDVAGRLVADIACDNVVDDDDDDEVAVDVAVVVGRVAAAVSAGRVVCYACK